MEYELINPSDPYTFIAKDLETAALVVFLLSTAYGAIPKDGGGEIPIFLFGGATEWYEQEFGRTPDDGAAAKKADIADALESFMFGHFEDRRRYNLALNSITDPERKAAFIEEWQDGHSSLNDIGTYAHNLAARLRLDNPCEEVKNDV